MNGHEATDSTGKRWIRNSASRIYTHVVVSRRAGSEFSQAQWAGSKRLAEKNAASWRSSTYVSAGGMHVRYEAEVIEATVVQGRVKDVERAKRRAE